jgi:cell division protein FtsZ
VPYTLQPAAPRQAPPPTPPTAPAYQPSSAPTTMTLEAEVPAGYEPGGYGDAPAARTQAQQRAPQPQRAPVRPAEPRIPGRSASLFAEAPTAPPTPAPRKSLFGIVTGAIRGQHAELPPAPAHPVQRAEPIQHDLQGEASRVHVRQASGEEASIDIPAFLRRQSS